MDRISTGIESLDNILSGGFPEGAAILIAGRPGTGKTILAHQMMFSNASAERKAVYLTTLAEPQIKVMKFQQQFDFFDYTKVQESVIYQDLGSTLRKYGPSKSLAVINELIQTHQPTLMVIDTIKTIADMIPGMTEYREFLLDLSLRLTTWGCTAILLGEYSEEDIEIRPESAIADGIILLYGTEEKIRQKRYLRILKMRGTAYTGGENVFSIGSGGIEIFPRLNASVNKQTYYNFAEKVSTGVPKLDEMMRGGIPYGTATLVSGASGTGKTILALNFILAGMKKGEKAVFITFEENPRQIIHSCLKMGINLQDYIDRGLLFLEHFSPVELDVDEHAYYIQRLAHENKAKRVVIDSISSFELGMADKIKYTNYIFGLTDYFKTQEVTVCLTNEIHNSAIASELTKHGISYVADNLILLKFIESDFELKRYLRVVKMRGSSHANTITEVVIDENGFSLK